MSDGIWGCPGDHDKRCKSEKIDMRWYPDTKSITLNGALKEEIKAKLKSLASVSKGLANAEDQNKIPDDRNEKEIHVNHECGLGNDSRNLSLEAFKSQLQTLSKKVDESEFALKNILNEFAEKHNCADDQNLGSELTCLGEENQGRSKVDNWGGGGRYSYIRVLHN